MIESVKTRKELDALRKRCAKASKAEKRKILVCAGTGCVSGGSLDIFAALQKKMEALGIPCCAELAMEPHGDVVGMKKSGCHGFCEMGPLVRIEPEGWLYTKVTVEDVDEIVQTTIVEGKPVERLAYKQNGVIYEKQEDIPFYHKQTRTVLEHCGHIDANSIYEYLAIGGYTALEKVLFDMEPQQVVQEILDSNLRGRGGGGFAAGTKWSQVARQKATPKYIVCNGDEGDPGAFMDRSIMEGDPHRMIEGMMIAGAACGASEGYIYVRAEYPMAVARLRTAIQQAEELGLLGDNILGSDFSFHMHINRGAGAFVCGEGSALTASIEGKRGMPRVKPPRTVEHGLFDKPTVLNNVETFANVSSIILNGAAWYKSIGPEKSPGTKAFALTGNIVNTGLIEVPMGTTLREVIFDIGGGIRNGRQFKAVQMGGPSGGCIPAELLDTQIDYKALSATGAIMGSGGMVVMDDSTCMVGMARFFLDFTAKESCGKCVQCRIGTRRLLEILTRITNGEGKEGDVELLEELCVAVKDGALCGLGQTAPNPLLTTIRYFRSEYDAHIREKRCPAKECAGLLTYRIDAGKCKGCSACMRSCPVGAISGKLKEPFTIDAGRCIRCGQCASTCRFGAIITE